MSRSVLIAVRERLIVVYREGRTAEGARARLPRGECLPEEKRKPWLYERWVGLTQADRDTFRAALDAADAPPTELTVA
jgi:hypothetical protein